MFESHIQGKFSQGIETFYFRGEKIVNWVTDSSLFAHFLFTSSRDMGLPSLPDGTLDRHYLE